MNAMVRVRFAPSPTGYLHVGGARTALFNWLLARRHGGTFILRIEDTDTERSSDAMVDGILEGLRWLGLTWDEGPVVGGPNAPYLQSQRLDRYRAMAQALLAAGRAYRCYCTPAELQQRREAAEREGGGWMYDRTCCRLNDATRAAYDAEGRPAAVRFLVPPGAQRVQDAVHGTITVDHAHIEDFVILRSDGQPTYHLSVVCDDIAMGITHVIRGDDHISNTPKQMLLYEAAGATVPQFAHVPLILGADKKRLSKRHGATSVTEYARQGYLPEAMVNFLALLGWSPGSGDQELFTAAELIDVFDLGGISGGNAVFNTEKLDWFNQQYLGRLSARELSDRVRPVLETAGLWDDRYLTDRAPWFDAVLALLQPRAKRLTEFATLGDFFFSDTLTYDVAAVQQHLAADGMDGHLLACGAELAVLDVYDAAAIERVVRAVADRRGLKAGILIHALRVAMTGRTVSPGLFEVMSLLGHARVGHRIVEGIGRARTPA